MPRSDLRAAPAGFVRDMVNLYPRSIFQPIGFGRFTRPGSREVFWVVMFSDTRFDPEYAGIYYVLMEGLWTNSPDVSMIQSVGENWELHSGPITLTRPERPKEIIRYNASCLRTRLPAIRSREVAQADMEIFCAQLRQFGLVTSITFELFVQTELAMNE
jgi:hypothetical protein